MLLKKEITQLRTKGVQTEITTSNKGTKTYKVAKVKNHKVEWEYKNMNETLFMVFHFAFIKGTENKDVE